MKRIAYLLVLISFIAVTAHATYMFNGEFIHDLHRLHVMATNLGIMADPFGGSIPGCEWPASSGDEYLYAGGLWIGATVAGVPHVSTATYECELLPGAEDPIDIIYESHTGMTGGLIDIDDDEDGFIDEDRVNGRDDDGDGRIDEDFAALSDQTFACEYRDDQPEAQELSPDHVPMHLAVHEESHGWAYEGNFYVYSYCVTNAGPQALEDVVLGLFVDPDIGPGGQRE